MDQPNSQAVLYTGASWLEELDLDNQVGRAEAIQISYNQGCLSFQDVNGYLAENYPQFVFTSRSQFFRERAKLGISGPRGGSKEERDQKAMDLLMTLQGAETTRGYRGTQHTLRQKGEHINRNSVYRALQQVNPDGLKARKPGAKKTRRYPIFTLGPNQQWSMDGHDKLAKWGFGIYGIRDVFSGYILGLHAFRNNRLKWNPHWLYLQTVRKVGGIPVQLATDCGSETGIFIQAQTQLRNTLQHHNNGQDLSQIPPHVFLKSIRNITIERAWVGVHNEVVKVLLEKIEEGLQAGFVPSNPAHCCVFWFLFQPLVQQALDAHVAYQNTYPVRWQKDKPNPSGGPREDFYNKSHNWGGQQCLLALDDRTEIMVQELMDEAEEKAILHWIGSEQEKICWTVLLGLGVKSWTQASVWDLFTQMLPWVQEPLNDIDQAHYNIAMEEENEAENT